MYFFNTNAKRKFNAAYGKNDDTRIDGIKIYRDGVITTPFAEYQSKPDKKRDILGLDKRMWQDIWDRIGSREVIGVLDITKENNPKIIDATNRQDFVDNKEYQELKDFIIEQLNAFSGVKIFERQQRKIEAENDLKKAKEEVKDLSTAITELDKVIDKDNLKLKPLIEPLKKQAEEVKSSVNKGIKEQKEIQKEVTRRENIYLSLMSLQEYAIRLSHAVRTSLGKIKRKAEFFKINFPNSKYDNLFKEYSIEIFEEMETLNKVIDFMLSYAGSNVDFEDFSVRKTIEDLLLNSYRQTFNSENIKAVVEIKDDLIINANRIFFRDIIQNLISNSIKALKDKDEKIIKCSGFLDRELFTLYFSDNGCGIRQGDEEKIFDIYYTTTAEEGGAGLGLFIAKTRIEALKGTIEVVEKEFSEGATFKITLPFKK
jgi:signal transduction histidine kinase